MQYKIGVIVAMEVEINEIRGAMQDIKKETISHMDFYTGVIDGVDVVAARCGVGKVCAAMCAQTMILRFSPQRLLGAGIAGALQQLPIGGVAIADRLAQHDSDLAAFGYPMGYLPSLRDVYMHCDADMVRELAETAESLGMPWKKGVIVSGDSFISAEEKKKSLLADFPDAVACEMDGAAIAQVCALNGQPFAVIRCISDNGDENSKVDYPAHEAKASAGSAAMVLSFIRKGK